MAGFRPVHSPPALPTRPCHAGTSLPECRAWTSRRRTASSISDGKGAWWPSPPPFINLGAVLGRAHSRRTEGRRGYIVRERIGLAGMPTFCSTECRPHQRHAGRSTVYASHPTPSESSKADVHSAEVDAAYEHHAMANTATMNERKMMCLQITTAQN
ncbi:uncharacterized protein LOC125554103 [Triticum urartu]|uniref:uncharacterized protein LOC125554103 n=1 Tax=Triticum urartu TaxID=4572 RepID=UPI0020437D0F|nr:uncharacterized protein LOC125554103 [Triticum urartu]